jgi:hypothetical protein
MSLIATTHTFNLRELEGDMKSISHLLCREGYPAVAKNAFILLFMAIAFFKECMLEESFYSLVDEIWDSIKVEPGSINSQELGKDEVKN